MLNPRKELFEKLIDKNGEQQMIVAVEELSELQKELCKALRNLYLCGHTDNKPIIEEWADVWIMLQQIKMFFDLNSEDIRNQIEWKLQRTKERCFGEENENRTD